MADQPTADTEAKTVVAALGGAKLTVAAGTTTFAAVVVNDGAVAKVTELKTRFNPELVIDYGPGEGANYTRNIDPRFILPGEPTSVALKCWSLGKNGWIVLGFPGGFPASPDYRLLLEEIGNVREWVDVYVAQDIDPVNPARHGPPYGPPYAPNGVFGAEDENADYRQATPEQTRPGPEWPAWVPSDRWLYLGWIRGQTGAASNGKLNLANIPYGDYYYLLLHDRRAINLEGADVSSIKIVQNQIATDLYLLLVIDNSLSASDKLAEYKNCIRSIIAKLPIGIRRVRLGVRLIEDAREFRSGDPDVARKISDAKARDKSEAAITTRRLLFAKVSESPIYWQLLDFANIAAMAEKVCASVTMDRLTSPILAALSAVRNEEFKELETELERKTCELRIILITDGFPDSYNRYSTPANLPPEERSKIANQVEGVIKNKLEEIRPGLSSNSFQLIGQYGENETWLKCLWASLGMVSILPLATGTPAPTNMHDEIPHTDCLNGSKESRRRIGKDEALREIAGQLPVIWTTAS